MLRSFFITAFITAGAATGLLASALTAPVFAASVTGAASEPPVIAPLPVDTSPDWTGLWAGGQLGFAQVGVIAGVMAGYDYDFGTVVVGGGVDYDLANTDIGEADTDLENVFRVRLRGGFEIGQGLLYGAGGYAQVETDTLGREGGYFLGAGYEYLVTPGFSYGGEVLYQDFDRYSDTPVDVNATTLQLRGTFRF